MGLPPARPTHSPGRQGRWVPGEGGRARGGRRGEAASAGRSGRRRGASQTAETGSRRVGAAALRRADRERSAEGARGAGRAACDLGSGWGGPDGNSAGGERLSIQQAASAPLTPRPRHTHLPQAAPIPVAPIGWAGQVSEREAGRERQSVRAPARRPGAVRPRPEDPGGSLGRGSGHCTSPPPSPARISSPGSLLRAPPTSELGTRLLWDGLGVTGSLLAAG